jgi:hypothetical protein
MSVSPNTTVLDNHCSLVICAKAGGPREEAADAEAEVDGVPPKLLELASVLSELDSPGLLAHGSPLAETVSPGVRSGNNIDRPVDRSAKPGLGGGDLRVMYATGGRGLALWMVWWVLLRWMRLGRTLKSGQHFRPQDRLPR